MHINGLHFFQMVLMVILFYNIIILSPITCRVFGLESGNTFFSKLLCLISCFIVFNSCLFFILFFTVHWTYIFFACFLFSYSFISYDIHSLIPFSINLAFIYHFRLLCLLSLTYYPVNVTILFIYFSFIDNT